MTTADTLRLTQKFAHETTTEKPKERFADHKVQGMYLRVMRSGAKAWIIRYKDVSGKHREMVIGKLTMPIDLARKLATQKLAEVSQGISPLAVKREAKTEAIAKGERTLAGVFEAYQQTPAYTTKRGTTRSGYDTSFNVHILPRIGGLPVDDIGTRQVADLLDALHRDKSGSVSNAAKRALSVVLGYAVEQELAPFNAAKQVKPRHVDKKRDRTLTDEELRGLWTAINELDGMTETVAGMLRLCMFLPARIGEIAGMQWSEVDLEERLWTVSGDRMKNHKDHEAPLSESVVALLSALKETVNGPWVFPNRDNTDHMAGKRAGRACGRLAGRKGWSSFGPHDLRRTYTTRIVEKVTADIVKRTLSHEVHSREAFAHYDHHTYREPKRKALEAWEQELLRIVEGEAAPSNVTPMSADREA